MSWMSKYAISSCEGKMSDFRKAQHGKVARGNGLPGQPDVFCIDDGIRRKASRQVKNWQARECKKAIYYMT